MKVFGRFAGLFKQYVLAANIGLSKDSGNDKDTFINNITNSIETAKIFEITDDVKMLLALTDPPKKNDKIRLPFPVLFFDVEFYKDEMKRIGIDIDYDLIIGIIVRNAELMFDIPEDDRKGIAAWFPEKIQVGDGLRISICSTRNNDPGDVWFDTFNAEVNIDDAYKDVLGDIPIKKNEYTSPLAREFIHKFVLNCINFINDPEIEWKVIEANTVRNENRLRKGKLAIPERHVVQITGKIKRYVSQVSGMLQGGYSHRFFVRGHFRTLKAPRYGENVGKRIWISPFIKGKGILIEKNYQLKEKKNENN